VALDPVYETKSLVHTGHYSVYHSSGSLETPAEVEGEIMKLQYNGPVGPAGIYHTQPRTGPTPTGTRL
jgi:hypothetical protein